jgi:ABC-type bacteriocin/lantibiotic exporter with double-glycine peptidase domain
MMIASVEKIIVSLDNVYDVLTSVEKLGKVTDKAIEEEGNMELINEQDGLSVEMNEVNFNYLTNYNATKNALSGITLMIEKNEKVCIMGHAGSGKSTLLHLLTGAYQNFTGSLLINKMPLCNYNLQSLRSQTGIVFSEQDIFEGTLVENIAMGWPGISVEHILEVAEKLGLKNYIAQLPQGLNTYLSPAGKKMPQKIIKKILLLRALINHPRLVMLEEPFNGIEETIKRQIIDYLLHETPHQTLLVISNNHQFASKCDKVIYMQDGAIKTMGNWKTIEPLITES